MMNSRNLYSVLFLVGAAMMAVTGCSVEIEGKNEPLGIETNEAKTISVLDPVHDRPFDVSLWVPDENEGRHLVLISHGFAGDSSSHSPLAEGLAALGYTVAAPTHPDLGGLEAAEPELDPLVLRPRHISLTIDHLEAANKPFDSVTVVGHSLGGYSALRVLGANPSGDAIDSHCSDNPNDVVLCNAAAKARFDGLATNPANTNDARIDRAVLLAPGYGPLFSEDDLVNVSNPILVIEAEADQELPGDQVTQLVANLPNSPEQNSLPGGHYVFLRSCTTAEASALPDLCTDPNNSDRVATAAELVTTIDDFARQT